MVDIKVLISTFFSLVIYRQYGVKGAATKRSNTKSSIIIDFEIFQSIPGYKEITVNELKNVFVKSCSGEQE